MVKRTVDLRFSDASYGCKEYGFIPRPSLDIVLSLPNDECASDEEDRVYEKHLKKLGFDFTVVDGQIWVNSERV